jgi:hypothetical protein
MRVQWLLDRRASRAGWSRRNASTEYQDDAIRAGTRNFTRLIEHRGLQPRFVSTEELRRGELANGDYRILMLPHTIALSSIEAREIRAFVAHGGIVVADCEPGIFDEHGRRMVKPALADVFAGPPRRATPGFVFGKGRAIYTALNGERGRGSSRAVSEILEAAGGRPRFPLARTDGGPVSDVETYVFENGEATIVALLRDFLPSASPSSRETVVMTLPHPLNGYDLRTGRRLGHTDRLVVELGPVEPLSCRCRKSRSLRLPFSGPRNTRLGGNAEFVIRPDEPTAVDVIHSMLSAPGETGLGITPEICLPLAAGPRRWCHSHLTTSPVYGQSECGTCSVARPRWPNCRSSPDIRYSDRGAIDANFLHRPARPVPARSGGQDHHLQ